MRFNFNRRSGIHGRRPSLCMALEQLGTGNSGLAVTDGNVIPGNLKVGASASSKLGFYGFTPVTQRAAALQNGSGVSATSSDWGATQAAWAVEVTATLSGLGLWKGAA